MVTSLTYKLAVIVLLAGTVGASAIATYYYQQQNLKISQASDLNTQSSQLQSHINDLNSQIASLNNQINSLNSLNTQVGGTNALLVTQILQLQTQVAQLQLQVSQLQTEIANLNQITRLQRSRVIASQMTVDRQSFTSTSGAVIALVNLGQIYYSGYLRVSWTPGPRMSFDLQEFDVNITTPIAASGLYSVPVSANATGSAWFQCFDYYLVNGVYVCTSNFTYSITYWY
jgi:prefoldin subunit 5